MLTPEEIRAVEEISYLFNFIAEEIIGEGESAEVDILELSYHAHGIQNMILSQAAARQYPDKYRLLGGGIHENQN